MFDQWFRSKKFDKTFSNLRQVILLKKFKDSVSQDLKTHLEDNNVNTLEEAAVISDTFTLSHKNNFFTRSQNNKHSKSSDSYNKSVLESQSSPQGGSRSGPRRFEGSSGIESLLTCSYCKRKGHLISEYFKLKQMTLININHLHVLQLEVIKEP